jgi:hypothetical protein
MEIFLADEDICKRSSAAVIKAKQHVQLQKSQRPAFLYISRVAVVVF